MKHFIHASKLVLIFFSLLASSCTFSQLDAEDKELVKLMEWQLGFATNSAQHEADKIAGVKPAWALSELRLSRIWHDREDGYWIYYEVSQPAIRPDRNEIWRVYRNERGNLKVDIHWFNDIEAGLEYWGKWDTPEVFDDIDLSEFRTVPGCNLTYHWISESNKFSGINSHGDCPVGNGYILQHIEISQLEDGTLQRNDWHTFFDGDGVAKEGPEFKLGTQGPYRHHYEVSYSLD